MRECRGNGHVVRVAAIDVTAGRSKFWTKILRATRAPFASPIGGIDPRDSNSVAFSKIAHFPAKSGNATNCLVTGHYRICRGGDTTFDNVEVSATYRAYRNSYKEIFS